MKALHLLLPSLALGGAALLVAPPAAQGWSLLGGSLSTAQRDFRIFNNFVDATANDNQTPDTSFPGHQGAVMAIWKAGVEWGSELHGTGGGDPHQPSGLGSGGANFDAAFAGEASGIGGTNDNIHSGLAGSSPGVLAFCESPISDGWRIRYYENWIWADGPGTPVFSQVDIQGVATHEYGHALGLDHSGVGGATMAPGISGTGVSARSIEADDVAGLQAIYGVKAGTKPRITGVSLSGTTLTISGTNFSTSGNEVWFAPSAVTPTFLQPLVVLTPVSSTGTQIVVTLPVDAGPGDVLVKKNASGNASLSNAWPVSITTGGGPGLAITSITPGTIEAVNPGTAPFVTINGSGFTPASTVKFDGVVLSGIPSPVTYVGPTKLTIAPPVASKLGSVQIEVTESGNTVSSPITIVANDPPALEVGNGDEPVSVLSFAGMGLVVGSEPGDLVVVLASPDLVPSVLPGWFDLAIGSTFTTLFNVATLPVAAKGSASALIPLPTLPPLTTFYVQTVAVDPLLTLPLQSSNVQEVKYVF